MMGQSHSNLIVMKDLREIQRAFGLEIQEWKNILLRGGNPEGLKKSVAGLQEASDHVLKGAESLTEHFKSDPKGEELGKQFIVAQKALLQSYLEAREKYVTDSIHDATSADAAVKGKDRPVAESLNSFSEYIVSSAKSDDEKAESAMRSMFNFGVVVMGSFFVVLTLASYLFSQSLSRALIQITEEVSNSGHQVNGSSERLAGASQQVSQASADSASSLEETVASLEELTSMVNISSKNAEVASNLSKETAQAAARGESELQKLVSAMGEIVNSSAKIADITSIIDDLAFQTNLLALNASVEAARAGEQGRGFAVVADAVRELAQKSGSAAQDIKVLIHESVRQIQMGSEMAHANKDLLKEISSSAGKVMSANSEIASTTQEQTDGIQQISKAMTVIDSTIQQNATVSETVAKTASEMTHESKSLLQLVDGLRGVVNGRNAA